MKLVNRNVRNTSTAITSLIRNHRKLPSSGFFSGGFSGVGPGAGLTSAGVASFIGQARWRGLQTSRDRLAGCRARRKGETPVDQAWQRLRALAPLTLAELFAADAQRVAK